MIPLGEVVELEIPPTMEYLDLARVVVSAAASVDPAFPPSRVSDLRLAVSEACTNAIQAELAGHPDGAESDPSGSPIVMRCVLADGHITVTVTDHGGGFDPDDLEAHPAVTDPDRLNYEGGLGIPLIKMLADELEFVNTDDGTSVVMQFEPRNPDPSSVTGRAVGDEGTPRDR